MDKLLKISIFLSRIALGWLFFYAGITKVLNSQWSAAGYLNNAKSFTGLYHWFASAQNIGWVNFINAWGMTLIGVALILGIFVRWASLGGMLLMVLYYFALPLLYPNANSFIVDEHIIYILVLAILFFSQAGKIWGLDAFLN